MGRFKKKYTRSVQARVRRNAKLINKMYYAVERKERSIGGNSFTGVDTTAQTSLLSTIGQGDTTESRDGEVINLKKIFIKGYIDNSVTSANDGIVRIVLLRYKNSQGANISAAQIFENTTVNGLKNWSDTNYDILYDQRFVVDTGVYSYIPFKISYQKSSKIRYNASGSAYAQHESGGIWLYVVSTHTANGPNINYDYRLKFLDP